MSGDDGRRWTIGELAAASRVTVRALYHYDEIGLLRASERTASGHRRYTVGDVRRLYRVRALRALGLTLPEIAAALAASTDDLGTLRALLTDQLADLRERSAQLRQLEGQVRELLSRLDDGATPDPDQFMTTLEMMSMFETAFTPEQREQLAQRRAELGPEAVEAAKERWRGLVEELLGHVQAATPVDDPEVQDLVTRWTELGAAFHVGGEQSETAAAARRMWQEHSAELSGQLPWPAERMVELVSYVEQARAAR